ncbi:cation transporter [Aurantimonas endophytica]|uniref:Cation diffusion facilitator family transporter n=1 Tax=Aurantimonas endophytica TaxID=1522175 RepID=A0A7W6HDG4_9HYPH|nr:cation transporter [Aurantimonas endophytica]MBB4003186.1 cation diffusion facilitator family transporter [Aurantimonas endophytica]
MEWWTLAWMASIIALLAFVLGSSQAMRTAWIEDILSLLPPAAFLIAEKFSRRTPSRRFPYGLQRFNSIAFLASAVALTVLGALLLAESALKLVTAEHPTIGSVAIFGEEIWLGWLMIAALIYSCVPPVILGRMKLPLAKQLQDKTLHTDADMNKADWMTGAAAIGGIVGVSLGFWWADAVAALIISFDVLRDGLRALRISTVELADGAPRRIDAPDLAPVVDTLTAQLDLWGLRVQRHLRTTGRFVTGEIVGPDAGLVTAEMLATLEEIDWRLIDLSLRPTDDSAYPIFDEEEHFLTSRL